MLQKNKLKNISHLPKSKKKEGKNGNVSIIKLDWNQGS